MEPGSTRLLPRVAPMLVVRPGFLQRRRIVATAQQQFHANIGFHEIVLNGSPRRLGASAFYRFDQIVMKYGMLCNRRPASMR